MTGSVSSETPGSQSAGESKSTGKTERSEGTTAAEKTQQPSTSPSNSPKDCDKDSKHFLPPISTFPSKAPETTRSRNSSLAVAASPTTYRKLSVPEKNMDGYASSLAHHGRARSYLTLYSKSSALDPIFNDTGDDERGFADSIGARSEVSAPVSRRRRRHDVRGYGTLERATSYSSLTMRPTLFRSANSARPPPAPPCTTTHLDYCRHPVNPAHHSRLARSGTPRANNPHPVGLHFQNAYNRDGKTFEIWNPDETVISNRLPQMCRHIEETNFSTGKMKGYTPERSGPPEINYSTGTVYRSSYRSPQGTRDYDGSLPTTRFGSTNSRVPAIGVVPNVMSPRGSCTTERRVKLHVPRGNKLESLV